MLDKSIPYVPLCMRRDPQNPLPTHPLPEGFRFVFYDAGAECDWARIETSVLEFDSEMDALLYFQKEFLVYESEAKRRCLFVETKDREKIATASAWWAYTGTRRDPIMHWVAVKPSFQGMGIGKALISKALDHMVEIEGDRAFYLSTQTWSHKAVFLYEWAGFKITDEKGIIGRPNDKYEEAMTIINQFR